MSKFNNLYTRIFELLMANVINGLLVKSSTHKFSVVRGTIQHGVFASIIDFVVERYDLEYTEGHVVAKLRGVTHDLGMNELVSLVYQLGGQNIANLVPIPYQSDEVDDSKLQQTLETLLDTKSKINIAVAVSDEKTYSCVDWQETAKCLNEQIDAITKSHGSLFK